MAKHIYFVRHGESESNAEKIHRGVDTPLTGKGRKQALQLLIEFSRYLVDVFCFLRYKHFGSVSLNSVT